ncbi:signal recognition particle receptor FtsY [Holospora obtusa F1]|uniref:Signal recognition particle receptor FtsY n=1 Tax=Holospora obtusa F1 TaxID=1399147 RepID=W6TEN2_HOLOB|nr:hypothetical protein [Holospora obtusa]ETZ07299.1 signal recognition particle receptor FtsY [Holospora obtusa F1]
MWKSIKKNICSKAQGLSEKIQAWFTKSSCQKEDLEELLLEADFGLDASMALVDYVERKRPKNWDQAVHVLSARLLELLSPYEARLDMEQASFDHPWVILALGVNGAGKTTVLGKLAHQWRHKSVRCIAGDTFRAGAQSQLEIWAQRANADMTKSQIFDTHSVASEKSSFQGNCYQDPGSVVYQGLKDAQDKKNSVILIDTAGRLPHRSDLMDELKKIYRVINKYYVTQPYTLKILLILDGTTGQHMTTQVASFQKILPLSGLIVNKMDGTARAGMLVSLTQTFKLPIYGIGVGEKLEDLWNFDAKLFSHDIFFSDQ